MLTDKNACFGLILALISTILAIALAVFGIIYFLENEIGRAIVFFIASAISARVTLMFFNKGDNND